MKHWREMLGLGKVGTYASVAPDARMGRGSETGT